MIKRFLAVAFVLISGTILAQRNSASPYSFFGIGDEFNPKTVEQSSMGGIGVAQKENQYLNFINPAANADLRIATYALAGKLSFVTLKETDATQSGNITSLRYIALGFPIGKKAGLSVGLQPLSSVGYSLLNQTRNGDVIEEVNKFSGTGGTNRIYASFGSYLFEGFSVGFEAGFIFGNIENSILNQVRNVAFATKYNQDLNIRGGQFKFGTQYKTKLTDKMNLHTGAALTLSSDLSARGSERLFSLIFSGSGQEIPKDEAYNRGIDGSVTIPLRTVVGFGLGKENKWYVGFNSEFSGKASGERVFEDLETAYRYDNAQRFSIGGYYIPKVNSISSYWDRVTYRAGVRFEDTGLLVKGDPNSTNFTAINDYGINVGVALPLPRQISTLNLGFEYGQRGTTNNNLIKENYFNVRLSLSLNDIQWFRKSRID
ncbi:membrane protein [Tenacibaculum holothuriorum]|uniref:Membrane protein n=1 Tax=Tenacibaculum holothuriorum TaxID=1635173 RepID=A0A1Y2P9T1_9FLAO|nr:hypothetical protein [Tenacibaculum holothuriorum]OSY87203.1 membrane protein [Tenacibaculum holothuriorum]